MKTYSNIFDDIISAEALFDAWALFKKGKNKRRDVQEFGRHLEKNIFKLQRELSSKQYRHGIYRSFCIHDPKVRRIRKACVRDRLVHQSVYTQLDRIFEPKFIHHLYSCGTGRGTHRGVKALETMARKVSRNRTRECWSLKCDIKKFYDSVDHKTLLQILSQTILDEDALWLLNEIIGSFHVEGSSGRGMPIGNFTSQIFTSIYLNELDQFVKHELRIKHYVRFADDIVVLSHDKERLKDLIPKIGAFLQKRLGLELHPNKIILRPLSQGIDFLGYVILPHHRVLRTSTKKRMKRKLSQRLDQYFDGEIDGESMSQTMQSYLGILSHADTHKLQQEVRNFFYCR